MLSTWAAALFPSERFGFGLGAISSELGFFLCDFFGTPPAALACFAGCFALALGMLTRYPDAALLVVASARAPSASSDEGEILTYTYAIDVSAARLVDETLRQLLSLGRSDARTWADSRAGMNRRTPSYEILREASMGPTQRQSLADHPDNDARAFAPGSPELRKQAASSEAEHRSLFRLLLLCAALFAAACVVVVALTDTTLAQLPQLLRDVASFRRTPCTAMDNAAAVALATAPALAPALALAPAPAPALAARRHRDGQCGSGAFAAPPDALQPPCSRPAAAHTTHATGDRDRHGNAAPRADRLHGVRGVLPQPRCPLVPPPRAGQLRGRGARARVRTRVRVRVRVRVSVSDVQ